MILKSKWTYELSKIEKSFSILFDDNDQLLKITYLQHLLSPLYHHFYPSELHFNPPSSWQASSFPPCLYIFAFQLNGEPPSLPRFHNPIKKKKQKKKDSLMCEERSMPAQQETMPAFLPWHERGEREREGKK